MSLPLTSPELTLQRAPGHASRIYAAFFKPSTVYSARLASVPSSLDKVYQISFTSPVGTLADVKKDMDLWVGSSAGAHDLGIVRVRKTPITGTFYVSEESDVRWQPSCHLTVVNYYDLHARHIYVDTSEVSYMDRDIAYSNQHSSFNPVPVMGGHRAVNKTGVSVETVWTGSNSWVIGSSITSYAWSCATASSSSGTTTATPIFSFNTLGWHLVTLVVTAANGKTSTGVRYVYVYDKDHLPEPIFDVGNPSVDYETGGWSFELSMAAADVADVPDRTLVILFREDYYGTTNQSIGALAGCENIECVGKIAEESITVDPEQSIVTFRIQGYHYWFQKIMGYPSGLEQVTSSPAAWTQMQNLTVDKALFHFLHWRTTATVIMDVYPTGDARLASELSSPAANLWSQISEFSFNTILAKPGVDRFGRLFIRIDPQCVPVADRDFPVVMTIEPGDWEPPIQFDRITVDENGLIDLSGVSVDASNNGLAVFSLAPGHVMKHYGTIETIDRLLLENQSLSNEEAGLLLAWRDNEFPAIEMPLTANNPVFDCFPPQYAEWTLVAGDNARGITIDGNLIPRRVERRIDVETGFIQTVVTFELATEAAAVNFINGDVPGSGDTSRVPSVPAFPPLPDFSSIILPIDTAGLGDGYPPLWIGHDTGHGFIYTINFNDAAPDYLSMNSGLSPTVDPNSANWIGVCPNGAVYVGRMSLSDGWMARAASLGAPWTLITVTGKQIITAAINPSVPEQVGFLTGTLGDGTFVFHVGTYSSYTSAAIIGSSNFYGRPHSLSYFSPGGWLLTVFDNFVKINAAGSAVTSSGSKPGLGVSHIRAAASLVLFAEGNASNAKVSMDNIANITTLPDSGINLIGESSGIHYVQMDCDPSGQFVMTAVDSLGGKNKSSDYAGTWASLGSLPVAARWCFAYAGMNGSLPRFVAAQAVIRATPDFGSTWEEKTTASLNAIAPFPNINVHKFVGLVPYGNP